MPVNWPTAGRVPNSAMEYIRQIRAFTAFSSLFEFKFNAVNVDNVVFRLHSNVTVLILLVGTMFVSMRQYFGEPIECITQRSDIPQPLLQHYCWLEATFSVSDSSHGVVGVDVAYPGVKPLEPHKGEKKIYHKYYQWVYFVLIIQAIMFYVPRYLWKAKEGRRLRQLISELRVRHILEMSEYDRHRLVQDVADNLLISNDYFYFFFFCEMIYFIHIIGQIWFTNIFLGGSFLTFGLEWLRYTHLEEDQRFDPLIRIFPRMTKCTFHKYGYSGTVETHDALCFLPLNIVNEKLYVVIWFWFAFLAIFTAFCLAYGLIITLLPPLRYRKLKSLAPSADKKYLRRLTSRVGNWFVLQFIARNMKPSHFRDLIEEVMKEHFNQEGKPVYVSKISKAITNGIQGLQGGSKDPKSTLKHKKKDDYKLKKDDKKKKDKTILEQLGNLNYSAPPPPPGFVVNRDPPSGQSDDWNEDWESPGAVVVVGNGGMNESNPSWDNDK